MELLEHEAVGGQIPFLDRAVVIVLQRFAKEIVGLALQGIQFFNRAPSSLRFSLLRVSPVRPRGLTYCDSRVSNV